MSKILIRTPNWLGDSVMAVPAVRRIRSLFPAAEITVLTKPGLVGLWELMPEVNRVIAYPGFTWSFIRELKKYQFEQAFILPNSWSSTLGLVLAGVPRRRGYRCNGRGWLLTDQVSLPRGWSGLHQIDYFLGLVTDLNNKEAERIPRIAINDSLRQRAREFLVARGWAEGVPLIGIHATASYGPAKCWLPQRFSELVECLKNKNQNWFFICGSAQEKEQVNGIINGLADRSRVINLAGETDLALLAGLLSWTQLFIANDSGPMHLAASLAVPVVAVFGSTDPQCTGPRGQAVVVKKDLPCSPCLERCCRRDLECMRQVTVDDVLTAVRKLQQDELSSQGHWRAALVMKDYDLVKGGAERYLAGLARGIAKRGMNVDLIVNQINSDPPAGLTLRQVPALRKSSILAPLIFNRVVQQVLKKKKYDLVYGLTQIYPQDVYRAGGGLEHVWFQIRYPKFWQQFINLVRPKVAVRLWLENRIFAPGNYKKIITNSRLCKNQLLSRYPIEPAEITVVYNGIEQTDYSPRAKELYRQEVRQELNIPGTDKVILFISHNWKRKGLSELITALGRINDDSLWLVVAGRGNPRRFHRLLERLGCGKRVLFVGTITAPWRYYGAADLFVLPTYYDPCANVCLEALACGLPVVTTRMNGASELISPGKNGYIIEQPRDINQLAEYMKKILFQRDRDSLAKAAAAAVKELTISRNVDLTIAVLQEAAGRQATGQLILTNNGYHRWLAGRGWGDTAKVMDYPGGQVLKKNKLRSVVKIEEQGKGYFLKRHFTGSGSIWALREWQNVFRLRALGINTMIPVAVGWEKDKKRGFIITEALEDVQRLEDFIPRYFMPPLSVGKKKEKDILIRELAGLTRQLHRNYLFHKDFYSGHIFVRREGDGFRLFLIDLQRVAGHRLFTRHWRIKDLASLNFSCPFAGISNSDRVRFLRYYLGEEDFTGRRRAFISRIVTKTEKIARHTEKILARRGQCQK